MRLHEFLSLPMDQKADHACQQGQFLLVRYVGCCTVVLYHLPAFFAEVWYRADENGLRTILAHGFKELDYLEQYMQLIDLAELME
jgi:hypothetical protein